MATFASLNRSTARRRGGAGPTTPDDGRQAPSPRVEAVGSTSVPWSIVDVPLHAPDVEGSTALDAEDEEGFVGRSDDEPAAEPLDAPTAPPTKPPTAPSAPGPPAAPPSPPPTAPPAPVVPPAPAPSGPTISSKTAKRAPSGAADTRSDVGVGETVDFSASVAGTWTATRGTASGAASTRFRWVAPATAGSVTVTLSAAGSSATKAIDVRAPNDIAMKNVGSHAAQVGAGGACMLTEVTFLPRDVCLGAIEWLEVPGPATPITGEYFKRFSAATLEHKPNTYYSVVDDKNVMERGPHNAANDHAEVHALPGPYKDGSFDWKIPNRYKLETEADDKGRWFTDTTQRFSMTAAGTLTITKAGATT